MAKRSLKLLLEDIEIAIDKINLYLEGFDINKLMDDSKTQDAVIRNFIIIGEASKRVPESYKSDYPQIPWAEIQGFRNRIVHEYFEIDLIVLFDIYKNELPTLLQTIKDILVRIGPLNY